MKKTAGALVILLCLFSGAAYALYFPQDALTEQDAQIRELTAQMRQVLETQRATIEGLPPERRQEMLKMNSDMIEKLNMMTARADEMKAREGVPPYAVSRELSSFLRSTMQRPW